MVSTRHLNLFLDSLDSTPLPLYHVIYILLLAFVQVTYKRIICYQRNTHLPGAYINVQVPDPFYLAAVCSTGEDIILQGSQPHEYVITHTYDIVNSWKMEALILIIIWISFG